MEDISEAPEGKAVRLFVATDVPLRQVAFGVYLVFSDDAGFAGI